MIKYSTEFRFPFSENPVVYAMLFAEAGAIAILAAAAYVMSLKDKISLEKSDVGLEFGSGKALSNLIEKIGNII